MPSEVTTEEMVEWLRTVAVAEAENDEARVSWWLTIAARLSALDKVAKAATHLKSQVSYRHLSGMYEVSMGEVDNLIEALKEAGYGK